MIDYRLLIIDYFVEIALRCRFEIGFELGLIGFVFGAGGLKLGLIGFELALIGFVFEAAAEAYIDIIHCYSRTYVHLGIQ